MGSIAGRADEECSVIGDKGDIGFIDFNDDKSVCSYNPAEEGPIVISVPFPLVGGKQVELWGVKIYASTSEDSFTLSLMELPKKGSGVEAIRAFLESNALEDRMLQPGETLPVWLSCKPKEIGVHTSVVHFEFEQYQIERAVFILADDKISQSLVSTRPFERRAKKKPIVVDCYVPECVTEGLLRQNYADHFKTLLMMEEIQLEESMRSYDMEHVNLRRRGYRYLSLEVPGPAERRPSLVHGDHVFAKLSEYADDTTSDPYQGYIHRVEADEVYLRFADEFHANHRDGNLYHVQFTYNRVSVRRLYQATDAAAELDTGSDDPWLQRRTTLCDSWSSWHRQDNDISGSSPPTLQKESKSLISRTYCLGFLSNPKRFNVAITRAKSFLIIIGNPHIISKDFNWNKLLWRCVDNNSYQGCNLPVRQEENYYENPTHEYDWDNNGENTRFSRTDSWVQGSWEAEAAQPLQDRDGAGQLLETEVPPPVDESEWSDGWK
ncbi:hypothetical protein ACLB2K_041886 [Fragaria x ananassa]